MPEVQSRSQQNDFVAVLMVFSRQRNQMSARPVGLRPNSFPVSIYTLITGGSVSLSFLRRRSPKRSVRNRQRCLSFEIEPAPRSMIKAVELLNEPLAKRWCATEAGERSGNLGQQSRSLAGSMPNQSVLLVEGYGYG